MMPRVVRRTAVLALMRSFYQNIIKKAPPDLYFVRESLLESLRKANDSPKEHPALHF